MRTAPKEIINRKEENIAIPNSSCFIKLVNLHRAQFWIRNVVLILDIFKFDFKLMFT